MAKMKTFDAIIIGAGAIGIVVYPISHRFRTRHRYDVSAESSQPGRQFFRPRVIAFKKAASILKGRATT
jgi:hypothetical protein